MNLFAWGKQGTYGDNKTPKPSFLDPIKLYAWETWNKIKGMKVATARENFINLCERILKKMKIKTRDPYKPGPNYYDGCFKKGKK